MKQMPSYRSRQSGAVLVVSLLLLLVLTILGVVMMQTTRTQERMAGNTRDLDAALQGAESALRAGEAVIQALPSLGAGDSSLPCASYCAQEGVLTVAITDPTQFNWKTQANIHATLPTSPAVISRYANFVPDSLDVGNDPTQAGIDYFEVDSMSNGYSGNANTTLQSTYSRRF
jgi:type IV pilus assembly protein PilX